MKGKIQLNDYGNYMLVQAENSSSYHMGPGFQAEIELMTDDEIREEFNKRVPVITIDMAKDYLQAVDGFCKSNVTAKDKSYTYGSMFKFKKYEK